MIGLAPGTKVFLACQPIDLRAGFDGLAAKVQQIIGADPFSGQVFIFRANVVFTLVIRSRDGDQALCPQSNDILQAFRQTLDLIH